VAIAHGIAAHLSVIGWSLSCEKFDECHVLDDTERARMRDVTRPAFKEWITGDFDIPVADVDAFWAETDRIGSSLEGDWADSYLK